MQEYEEVQEEPLEDPNVKDCDKDTATLLKITNIATRGFWDHAQA